MANLVGNPLSRTASFPQLCATRLTESPPGIPAVVVVSRARTAILRNSGGTSGGNRVRGAGALPEDLAWLNLSSLKLRRLDLLANYSQCTLDALEVTGMAPAPFGPASTR